LPVPNGISCQVPLSGQAPPSSRYTCWVGTSPLVDDITQ